MKIPDSMTCSLFPRYGQFMISLLPPPGTNEKGLNLGPEPVPEGGRRHSSPTETDLFDPSGSALVYSIKLRNFCLDVLLRLLTSKAPKGCVNQQSVAMETCHNICSVTV